jgi:hypothetical protein
MGVWEDALREAAAQRYADVQAVKLQRIEAGEQTKLLADFIDGMNRLGVRPRRQPFLVLKEPVSKHQYRASRRHKIVGWDIGAGAVVTPDGLVYDMTHQDKEPRDLSRPQRFGLLGERSQSLSDLLRTALQKAKTLDGIFYDGNWDRPANP